MSCALKLALMLFIEGPLAVHTDHNAGNINAPRAITHSAIIYCLRSLISEDIPLNQGCLNPIKILIPEKSFLSPSDKAAVVAGNVLTVSPHL